MFEFQHILQLLLIGIGKNGQINILPIKVLVMSFIACSISLLVIPMSLFIN